MQAYIVQTPWQSVYPNPLLLHPGDEVRIDLMKTEENPDWHGWIWVSTVDNSGWVPEQMIKVLTQGDGFRTGVMIEQYSAREMNVIPGEMVFGDTVVNGWLWGHKENSSEYCWVPMQNLHQLP